MTQVAAARDHWGQPSPGLRLKINRGLTLLLGRAALKLDHEQ